MLSPDISDAYICVLIKDIVRTFTNAYKIKDNDDRASLTWELVEYFVNGLDCLVSCPKFLLHLEPKFATGFYLFPTWRMRTGKLGKLGTQGWKDTCCKARSSLRILRKLENFGKLESIPKTDRGDLSKREEHLQPAPLPEYSGPAFLVCTSLEPLGGRRGLTRTPLNTIAHHEVYP